MANTTAGLSNFSDMLKLGLGDLVDQGANGFLAMMSEDAVMEFPYAPVGQVKQVSGRTELAAYLARLGEVLAIDSISAPRVHRTVDPGVVILEFTGTGRGLRTGKPYDQTYISVITVRDGRIAHYRDYWNPLVTGEVLGDGSALPDSIVGAEA